MKKKVTKTGAALRASAAKKAVKKAPAKKAPVKKAVAKKAPAKKVVAKKAPVKKVVKKTTSSKKIVKKAPPAKKAKAPKALWQVSVLVKGARELKVVSVVEQSAGIVVEHKLPRSKHVRTDFFPFSQVILHTDTSAVVKGEAETRYYDDVVSFEEADGRLILTFEDGATSTVAMGENTRIEATKGGASSGSDADEDDADEDEEEDEDGEDADEDEDEEEEEDEDEDEESEDEDEDEDEDEEEEDEDEEEEEEEEDDDSWE